MGEEKEVKPKQTGMALEMDAIKKISHQLERLPASSAERVVRFVQDWATDRSLSALRNAQPSGQLPLAQDLKNGLGQGLGFPE